MIASPCINTELWLGGEKAWSILAWLDGDTLGEVLRERRKDLKGQAGYLSQGRMAQLLKEKHGPKQGPSQASISNIENDLIDLSGLYPEVRRDFLKLYGFTDSELERLDERFNLKLPSDVRNFTPPLSVTEAAAEYGLVEIRVLGDSNKGTDPVLKHMVRGRDAAACFVIYARGGVLACERIRRQYGDSAMFVFAEGEKPTPGKPVVYKMKDTGRLMLCIHHVTPPVFVATDYEDPLDAVTIYPNDERLEYLGALLSYMGWT